MCDPRTPPISGFLVRTVERWQMRSTHGPVQLRTQVASTRCSLPVVRSRKSTPRARPWAISTASTSE
jgi:hypothetical protein